MLTRSLAAFYPTSMATALRLAGSLDTPRHMAAPSKEQSQKLSSIEPYTMLSVLPVIPTSVT